MNEDLNPYQAPLETINTQPEKSEDTKTTLLEVARAQRLVNIGILLYLLTMLGNMFSGRFISPNSIEAEFFPYLMILIVVGILAFIIYSVARLAYALHGIGNAIIYSVAMLMPCLGLVLLLFLSARATELLKRHGIKVGLMGANPSSLQ